MRDEMVDNQLKTRGIRQPAVLGAMPKVPRHLFVPAGEQPNAYVDGPLPIGLGQTISQPYIVAYMTQELALEPQDRVLEIGTGSGYQTAVLAEIAQEVYTVELLGPLQEQAQKILAGLGYRNIHYRLGDGWEGWPEHAPYDKIIVTAAAVEIPKALAAQLKEGGRIVIPVGAHAEAQRLLAAEKHDGMLQTKEAFAVRFVPLVQSNATDPKKKGDRDGKEES